MGPKHCLYVGFLFFSFFIVWCIGGTAGRPDDDGWGEHQHRPAPLHR